MSKNIVRIDESGLRRIVAEGVKKVLNHMLKESMADYEWERQMDMQDRYEEEQFMRELGGKTEVDYWARKGWLSPKQQVFNLFGFLDNVHRKPTVPLLDDEQLNAAIEKAAKLKATYE